MRLKKDEGDFFVARCVELPGAISQGKTKEEALRNVKEAVELVLEVLREQRKGTEFVEVEVPA